VSAVTCGVGRVTGSLPVVRTGDDVAGCDGSLVLGAEVIVGETATGSAVDGCEVTIVCGVDENVDACGVGSGDGAAALIGAAF
jgi:hypothetical protein